MPPPHPPGYLPPPPRADFLPPPRAGFPPLPPGYMSRPPLDDTSRPPSAEMPPPPPAHFLPPRPADLPSPRTVGGFQVVRTASLEAVPAKLNIKIPVEDFVKALREEDEARRVEPTAEAIQRHAALSKFALQPFEKTAGIELTVPKSIPNPTTPINVDPFAKERRRRLLELTKEAFPDGKVSDPYTIGWLNLTQDVAIDKLPC